MAPTLTANSIADVFDPATSPQGNRIANIAGIAVASFYAVLGFVMLVACVIQQIQKCSQSRRIPARNSLRIIPSNGLNSFMHNKNTLNMYNNPGTGQYGNSRIGRSIVVAETPNRSLAVNKNRSRPIGRKSPLSPGSDSDSYFDSPAPLLTSKYASTSPKQTYPFDPFSSPRQVPKVSQIPRSIPRSLQDGQLKSPSFYASMKETWKASHDVALDTHSSRSGAVEQRKRTPVDGDGRGQVQSSEALELRTIVGTVSKTEGGKMQRPAATAAGDDEDDGGGEDILRKFQSNTALRNGPFQIANGYSPSIYSQAW